MAKIKNRILIILALVMLCAVGLFALSACGGSETYTVTFMVRENGTTGDWQQYTTVDTNDDGSVTLPVEPTVDGYTFRDWYTDEACSADNVFDESNVTGDIIVYALMAEASITLNITDGSGTASQVAGTLSALSQTTSEQEAAAAEENLTFDGWYTDAAFTQKYSNGMDATTLYGRYMAVVTFNNGYTDLYSTSVVPGNSVTAPNTEDIVTYYMDSEDVSYIDSLGNTFNFSSAINENTIITVLWKTPYAIYTELSNGDLVFTGFDMAHSSELNTYPVISILSNITYNGTAKQVTVAAHTATLQYSFLNKIIFGDGIKMIRGFNSIGSSSVNEIVLPDSLEIIESAFSGLSMLESVELPEGLQIIIDSFWKDITGERKESYDFTIEVPASVENMAMVPQNGFTFSNDSPFEVIDGALYKNDGGDLILISDRRVDDSGYLEITEQIDGIQAGAFSNVEITNLILPESFSYIVYNEPLLTYQDFYFYTSETNILLFNEQYSASPIGHMSPSAYSIVDYMESIDAIAIRQNTYPGELPYTAFIGYASNNYRDCQYSEFAAKIYYIGSIASGEDVDVQIIATNTMTGVTNTYNTTSVSGETLNRASLLEIAGIVEDAEDDSITYNVLSIKQFGADVDFTVTINCNQYIVIEYEFDILGFTYEDNGDGTLTVTGFDSTTAHLLDNNSYVVAIPEEIDGKTVTTIGEGAFEGENAISTVYIPVTVTEICANAFKNATNLSTVSIAPGGLEIIGRSAFENTAITTISFALAPIKDIQPYAFKTPTLESFVPVEGEENRYIFQIQLMAPSTVIYEGLEVGMYFYGENDYSIVKYMGVTKDVEDESGTLVDVYDVQYVATAGGTSGGNYGFYLGYSMRTMTMMGMPDTVMRWEIMEGSVYYTKATTLRFGIVSRIHKNAFTDMPDEMSLVTVDSSGTSKSNVQIYQVTQPASYEQYDKWLEVEQITAVASIDYVFANVGDPITTDGWKVTSPIFEDGWWEGIMSNDPDYEKKMEFMKYAVSDSHGLN